MTCEDGFSAELEFLESGIIIEPYELTARSEQYRYEKLDVTMSREAAQLVVDKGMKMEPVVLSIGGTKQGRYYLPTDAVQFQGDLGAVKIFDALKVLGSGTLSKHFHDATVESAVRYVNENKQDPYDVITGYEIVGRDVGEMESESYYEALVDSIDGGGDNNPTTAGEDSNAVARGWINLVGEALAKLGDRSVAAKKGGFDFNDLTPAEALGKIQNEFSLQSWVTNNGTLTVGHRSAVSDNPIGIGMDNAFTDYKMKEYNVTRPGTPVSKVIIKGTPTTMQQYGSAAGAVNQAQIVAQATAPGIDGTTMTVQQPTTAEEPEAVENAAARKLAQVFAKQKAGSITFNSVASEATEDLATINVGTRFAVTRNINQLCPKESEGGLFMATAVTQSLTQSTGWETSVELASLVPRIDTSSYIYDLSNSKRYPDLDAYKSGGGNEVLQDAQESGDITDLNFDFLFNFDLDDYG